MRATYRLQLRASFGFAAARALVPYLRDLGVSHLYLSPIMQARADSAHGYDVTDPTRVSAELGGADAFRALAATAHDAGLGVIVDFVPNHMARGDENPFWRDAELRRRFFDIDAASGWQRRFFTIDELAGVRVEDPEVFDTVHGTLLELIEDGAIDGLRIDHPDGLADPAEYLERLATPRAASVWVEKILASHEQLRDWPVAGTTGYEFANDVTALFVDERGEETMTTLYTAFTGDRASFAQVAAQAKLEWARGAFAPELAKLRELYDHPAMEAAVAALPVYRSYVQPRTGHVEQADRDVLGALPDDLRRVLLLAERGQDEFVTRFQQTTGPVMAKGVEDTALYRSLRLTALNEVGGDPDRFSLSVDAFHAANLARARRFPQALLASQTHDTKRSGDVRAGIGALAAVADEWAALVWRWLADNEPLRSGPGPDRCEEYLIYQTLAGAWPIEPDRLAGYLEKAMREAARNTSWANPDERWERSVQEFARRLPRHPPFRKTFDPFLESLAPRGESAALGALLLQLTCPGVGDIYQGDELWSRNLVDPDNRRAVDWDVRRRLLEDVRAGRAPARHARKLHLIHAVLALRTRRPEPFAGAYVPLAAAAGVCAFARAGEIAVVVALREDADVRSATLPAGAWHSLLPDGAGYERLRLLELA